MWHTRQLNNGYCRCSLLYIPISAFIFSIILYKLTHNRRQARGCHHHIHWPAAPETASHARPVLLIDKGVNPKKDGYRFYSSQYGDFSSCYLLFSLNKDANNLLPADFPVHRLPAHSAAAKTQTEPTPTRDIHWDTQHPGCQGLWTGTGHIGGGTRWVVSRVTDIKNLDGGVLKNPERLRHDVRCGAPISRRWSTGWRGVGNQPHTLS